MFDLPGYSDNLIAPIYIALGQWWGEEICTNTIYKYTNIIYKSTWLFTFMYRCIDYNLIAPIYIALGQCSVMMRIRLIYKLCQVFNLYAWESEAEEHLRSYSCIAVTSFFRSQCRCFRDSWYLKIVSKVATPRRGSCLNSSRLEPLLSKGHMMPQVLYEPVRSQLVDNSPLVTVVC